MDKEKERDLIDAAKLVLKRTEDFSRQGEANLVRIHNHYLEESALKYMRVSDLPVMFEQGKKICNRFLKESRGNLYLHFSREAVKQDLDSLKRLSEATKGVFSKAKRGRRADERLNRYISWLAIWFNTYAGKKPGYGTSSVFLRFVSVCLAVVDESAVEPEKAIRRILTEFKIRYPYGLPHFEMIE